MPPYAGKSYTPNKNVSAAVTLFANGFIGIDVPDIVPGQPVTVTWRFVCVGMPDAPEYLKLRILIDGRVVLDRVGVNLQAAKNSTMETLNLSDADKQVIYKFGRHTVAVELTTERQGVWRSGTDRFRVVAEPLDASWWTWRSAPFESIKWKDGYSLIGEFHNRCRFAKLSLVSAELSEVRSEEDPSIDPCAYLPVQTKALNDLVSGKKASLTYDLKHEWSWFIPGGYIFTGPINKTFAYAAFVSAIDEFGNVYWPFCTSRLSRHVGVSKGKKLAFASAQSCALAAAAAGPFAWPYAAFMYGLATGFGLIAKDPPEPDFDFISPPRDSEGGDRQQLLAQMPAAFSASSEFLGILRDVIREEEVRTMIRSKLIGASIRSAKADLIRLRGDYGALHDRLSNLADRLVEITPVAAQEFEEQILKARIDEAADLIPHRGRIVPGMENARQTIVGLEALLKQDDMAQAVDAGLNPIPAIATAVRELLGEMLAEKEKVLAGETYVDAETVEDLLIDERGVDVGGPGLRRGNCCC